MVTPDPMEKQKVQHAPPAGISSERERAWHSGFRRDAADYPADAMCGDVYEHVPSGRNLLKLRSCRKSSFDRDVCEGLGVNCATSTTV
jgi:hypothetical protein